MCDRDHVAHRPNIFTLWPFTDKVTRISQIFQLTAFKVKSGRCRHLICFFINYLGKGGGCFKTKMKQREFYMRKKCT